jgi:hypothetical protein
MGLVPLSIRFLRVLNILQLAFSVYAIYGMLGFWGDVMRSILLVSLLALSSYCFADDSPYKLDKNPHEKGVEIHTRSGDGSKYVVLYKKKVKDGVEIMVKSIGSDSTVLYELDKYDCKGSSMELGEGDTKKEAEQPLQNPNQMLKYKSDDFLSVPFAKYACK